MSQYDNAWRDYHGPTVERDRSQQPAIAQPTPKRRSKYGSIPHVVLPSLLIVPAEESVREAGCIRFDSKKEAERFVYLRGELEAGRIQNLLLQPQFPLTVVGKDGVRVVLGRYIADFEYVRDGTTILEDVKGMQQTPALYRWKVAHLRAEHGIVVAEVR
jgi:hypothetical protein